MKHKLQSLFLAAIIVGLSACQLNPEGSKDSEPFYSVSSEKIVAEETDNDSTSDLISKYLCAIETEDCVRNPNDYE